MVFLIGGFGGFGGFLHKVLYQVVGVQSGSSLDFLDRFPGYKQKNRRLEAHILDKPRNETSDKSFEICFEDTHEFGLLNLSIFLLRFVIRFSLHHDIRRLFRDPNSSSDLLLHLFQRMPVSFGAPSIV